MIRFTRFTLTFVILAVFASLAMGQQPNSPQASLTLNGDAGLGSLITADVPSPGAAVLRVEAEPGSTFALAYGNWAPGWFTLAGLGIFDLHTGAGLGLLLDGFNPRTALDNFAKTDAEDGVALLAAATPSGLTGFSRGFQGIVEDPTQLFGVRFTAAARMNFVAPTGGSILFSSSSSMSGSGGSSGGVALSSSGMAGGFGGLLAEIRAPLDAIGMTNVTVLQSLFIETSAATNWRDLNNNSVAPATFAVGDYVKVEAVLDPATGTYHAHQIRQEVMRAGYDVKVEAPVNSATATTVTVLGVPFAVVAGTDDDVPGGVATLAIDDFVEIKANLVAGSYEIVEIHPENPEIGGNNNVAFRSRSYVDATTATSITVLGVEIQVGAGTRFDNIGSLAALSTSSYVEVRANPDASGQLFASRIKLRSPDSEVRVEGPVEMLMNPDFTIWGVSVQTNGNTDWQQGLTGFGDLSLGLRVQAQGFLVGGVIVADEVEIDDE